MKQAEFK